VPQHDLTQRLIRLRSMPVLTPLPSSDLAQVAGSLRRRTFAKGETLTHEDERPRSVWLLESGTVTMRRKGKRIGTVRAPGGVGFMSLLARTAGGTAAVADSLVEALELRGDVLEEVFEDHFQALLLTLRFVADRMLTEMMKRTPPPFTPPAEPLDQLVGAQPLGVVERIFLLRRTRAFSQSNVNSLATFAKKMEERRVPAGEVLWRVGERSDKTIFLVKGMARLVSGGGEKVQRVGPGYVIGGAEGLTGRTRWNEFVTDEPVVLLQTPREAMIALFEDDLELSLQFLSMMATLVISLWDENADAGIASVGSGPASERRLPAAEDSTPGP
jgi:CRP-like cAMP-binding protein